MSDNPLRNQYAGWARAFEIFAAYKDTDEHPIAHVAAEHDIIYAGPDISLVSQTDKDELESLGWRLDERLECFYRFT